ncbi:hypothetical protein HK405_010416, partial [Cladochytrium tenue]
MSTTSAMTSAALASITSVTGAASATVLDSAEPGQALPVLLIESLALLVASLASHALAFAAGAAFAVAVAIAVAAAIFSRLPDRPTSGRFATKVTRARSDPRGSGAIPSRPTSP